ncbi:hypothetical protein ES703_115612 [subsurface metagenome]
MISVTLVTAKILPININMGLSNSSITEFVTTLAMNVIPIVLTVKSSRSGVWNPQCGILR